MCGLEVAGGDDVTSVVGVEVGTWGTHVEAVAKAVRVAWTNPK
jgi:hypothetical protein